METLETINIQESIEKVEVFLKEDKTLSVAAKAFFALLILIIRLLLKKFKLDSQNSSTPPRLDPNRQRGSKREKSTKKQGGQNGHKGYRLEKVPNPDRIETILVDRQKLPKGEYKEVGYESRQVVDIEINRVVTEYRAQVLEDQDGKKYKAQFPDCAKKDVQYGTGVKVHSIYLSQFQLLPYERIQDELSDQMGINLSTGTLVRFNQEAYDRLEDFDKIVKQKLINSPLLHIDETGININKKLHWLHSASNEKWTYFHPHKKRGKEAMDAIGILPLFKGIGCHDHWKPYFKYDWQHALCNAHHLRELTHAEEDLQQSWAKEMRLLLIEIKKAVEEAGRNLSPPEKEAFRKRYRDILSKADAECPEPEKPEKGRPKRSKARNLLERLRDFEKETLLFMDNPEVPFTNNRGENDLRMTKVQQKISGCFRSMEGAYLFCRIRSYLSTCRKNAVSATDALHLLFHGKLPDFMLED